MLRWLDEKESIIPNNFLDYICTGSEAIAKPQRIGGINLYDSESLLINN